MSAEGASEVIAVTRAWVGVSLLAAVVPVVVHLLPELGETKETIAEKRHRCRFSDFIQRDIPSRAPLHYKSTSSP